MSFDFIDNKLRMQRASQFQSLAFYRSKTSWLSMATLTFADAVGPDPAMSKFKFLVKALNRSLFGNSYVRVVGHSYFSYLLGIEFQRRGVEHFHVLIDRKIDYARAHLIWHKLAGHYVGNKFVGGFAWIDALENQFDALNYVTKYVLKGGETYMFQSLSQDRLPSPLPLWWCAT